MPTPKGPYGNFNFLVEISGIAVAGFAEVTGLSSEVEVIEYRDGGDPTVRKLPGARRFGDIVLKRGVTDSRELQDWHQRVLNGQIERRDGSVVLLDEAKHPVVRWNFFGALPVKWEGPALHAGGNDVAIETLTLCCQGLERA